MTELEMNAMPAWELVAVEPTPKPGEKLVTLNCPVCGNEFSYRTFQEDYRNEKNAQLKRCRSCFTRLRMPDA